MVKNMVKYKCIKMRCPICGSAGSCQLFINRDEKIKYVRVRHYKGLDESKKPQFEYHKVKDLEPLKTLKVNDVFLSTVKTDNCQFGQGQKVNDVDPKLKGSSSNCFEEPPLGFEPRTFSLQG
jgi:hypothetical protein